MKTMNRIVMTCGLALAVVFANAQEVSPVDFMRMNPYQIKTNPAESLPYSSVFSILIGNASVGLQNSGLYYDNAFDFDANGVPKMLNLRKLADGLSDENYLGINASNNFFTLYRRLSKGMLTIGYDIRMQGEASYNGSIFKMLGYGNSLFVGDDNPATLNVNANLMAFQQLSVGYQLDVTEKLSFGVRGKLLLGLANVTTDVFNVNLYLDPSTYSIRVQEDAAMRMCVPRVLVVKDGKLKLNKDIGFDELFKNPGFGLDLGAEYHITDQIGVVAAVTDLGFISWSGNDIAVTGKVNDVGPYYDNGDFLFTGLNGEQIQNIISDPDYREKFVDTLKQYFMPTFSETDKYTTKLNTNLMLRGYYDINPQNRVTLQLQGQFMGTGFRPAATLAYSGSFFKMLDVCATYTIMKDSYTNFGIGLGGNFGPFHIYAATGNIFDVFNPLNAKNFNAQAGIVFNLRED